MSLGKALPLNYVREALAPNEKIIHVGRFHWFYDAVSWFWLFLGLGLAAAIIAGASAYVLHVDMGKAFPDIKPEMEDMARERIVGHYGGWLGLIQDLHIATKIIAGLCVLWGVYMFVSRMIIKYTTEIAITSQRLIVKHGIVARSVGEMKLDRIEGVNVWQSFFGRIFNYGHLAIHGIGVGNIALPNIEQPIRFRKALDYARTRYDEQREVRMEEIRERVDIKNEGKIDPNQNPVDN